LRIDFILQLRGLCCFEECPHTAFEDWLRTAALRTFFISICEDGLHRALRIDFIVQLWGLFISASVRTPLTQLWGLISYCSFEDSSSLRLWGLPSHSFEDCLHLCICDDCLHTAFRTVFTSAAFRTVFICAALRSVFICTALRNSSLLFCSVFFLCLFFWTVG
jgi:hypothetical protein